MIEWLKQEKIPLLTILLFLIIRLIINIYETYPQPTPTIVGQMLVLFSISSIISHQYQWDNLNKETIIFILTNAIIPIALIYLFSFIYEKSLHINNLLDHYIIFMALPYLYKLTILYSLLLPSMLFITIQKPQESINNNYIQKLIIFAFSASIYLLLANNYVIHFGISLMGFNSLVNKFYAVILLIITLGYLYFWYQPIFAQYCQKNDRPLMVLNVCILIVSIVCMIMTVPATIAFAVFIYLGGTIIGMILAAAACLLTFTLSSLRYYKIYNLCALLFIAILLYLQSKPINFILLSVIQLSFAILFYGFLSRFILKRILRKMK